MALRKKKTQPESKTAFDAYYRNSVESSYSKGAGAAQLEAMRLANEAFSKYSEVIEATKPKEAPPVAINPDLKPVGDDMSHKLRMRRLGTLTTSLAYEVFQSSPFFSPEAIRETFDGTQFGDENHRRVTPYLQELYQGNGSGLMASLDEAAEEETFRLLDKPNAQSPLKYDVAIIGSGPHGTAMACNLREMNPQLRILIIEASPRLGGQWRSYGPKPVFQMNSRVRKADRRMPSLPRTAASINPLGKYAMLELSDIPTGGYPWNTEMGNVCALNAFLAATDVMVGAKVATIEEGSFNYEKETYGRILRVTSFYGERTIVAPEVIDATGLSTQSRIVAMGDQGMPGYYTAKTFYEHFATHANPLEAFSGKKVAVIGRGDSALTILEALIGNLPSETYGRSGVGRMRPRRIDWFGARSSQYEEVERCLRTRYKNGIVQSIRRNPDDECGVIVPTVRTVSRLNKSGEFFDLLDGDGATTFPNIVIDTTAGARRNKELRADYMPTAFVGVQTGREFTQRTRETIDRLGITENLVSLWATMEQTDQMSALVANKF